MGPRTHILYNSKICNYTQEASWLHTQTQRFLLVLSIVNMDVYLQNR